LGSADGCGSEEKFPGFSHRSSCENMVRGQISGFSHHFSRENMVRRKKIGVGIS
jgi:hypothetical protein